MSSDLYVFDNSFFRQHSSPEMVSSDAADLNFSAEPFSPFCDSSLDFLQAISSSNSTTIINPIHPVDESSSIDQFAHTLLSCSPPSHLLENLSLCQSTHLQQPLANGYHDFSSLDALEVKSEESLVGFDSSYNHHHHQQQRQQQPFAPHSYSGVENVAKYMQRSYSSNSFDNKPGFLFQPRFDTLMESPNFHNQALSSPESNFFSGQMRRVCSTGDLQNIRTAHKTQRSLSSHLATESSFTEEANFKVGRYSAEERKERILKYRAKRNQRNFNKTIKYACRKTLADNRPRIRGRFARNDETGETPKAACAARDEDEDELWLDGLHEEDDHGAMRGAAFVSSYGQHQQLQYYGCF
nr:CONSTANS-like 17 [Mangifera indica]